MYAKRNSMRLFVSHLLNEFSLFSRSSCVKLSLVSRWRQITARIVSASFSTVLMAKQSVELKSAAGDVVSATSESQTKLQWIICA